MMPNQSYKRYMKVALDMRMMKSINRFVVKETF